LVLGRCQLGTSGLDAVTEYLTARKSSFGRKPCAGTKLIHFVTIEPQA
jgi:hypothetical protein